MKIVHPIPVIGLSSVITLLLLTQSIYPVIKMEPRLDMTNELYGWPEAGRAIQLEYEKLLKEKPTVVFTRRLNMAAPVCFYTPGHIPAYSITGINEQYDIWGRGTLAHLPKGANGLYVADSRYEPGKLDQYGFKRFEALPPIEIVRAGRVVRRFFLFRFYDYQG